MMETADAPRQLKHRVLLGITAGIFVCILLCAVPLMLSDVFYQLGVSAVENGNGASALSKFEIALFFDNDNSEIYRGIGEVYQSASQAEMEIFFRQNRTRKIVTSQPPVKLTDVKDGAVSESVVKVKKPTPGDIKTNIKKGSRDESRFTEQIIFYTPPYPGSAKEYEKKAVAAFKQGLLINPYDARLYHGLAEMMQFAASFRETESVFKKAVELDPHNPNIHYSFGMFYLRKGNKSKALREMRNAVSIYPPESHRAFRSWLENGGKPAELIDVAGTSPSGLYRLGLFYEKLKQPERAADAFLRGCSVIGGNVDYRELQEDSSVSLLPKLLDKLAHYKLNAEFTYYDTLWSADLKRLELRDNS